MTQRQIAYRGVHRIEWLWYDKAKRQPLCVCGYGHVIAVKLFYLQMCMCIDTILHHFALLVQVIIIPVAMQKTLLQ